VEGESVGLEGDEGLGGGEEGAGRVAASGEGLALHEAKGMERADGVSLSVKGESMRVRERRGAYGVRAGFSSWRGVGGEDV
jgi:hypothetical protein